MGDPRPTNPDPESVAQLLTETGNGPTVDNEQDILAEVFGAPNDQGVYGAPTSEDGAA